MLIRLSEEIGLLTVGLGGDGGVRMLMRIVMNGEMRMGMVEMVEIALVISDEEL